MREIFGHGPRERILDPGHLPQHLAECEELPYERPEETLFFRVSFLAVLQPLWTSTVHQARLLELKACPGTRWRRFSSGST